MKQIVLAGVLLALVSPAQAIPIVFSQSFTFGPAGVTASTQGSSLLASSSGQQNLSLPRFNASLGTLNSASVSIASSWFHSGELVADDPTATITNFISCSILPTVICTYTNDTWVDASISTFYSVALTDPAGASTLSGVNLQSGSCAENPSDPRVRGVSCQTSLGQAGSFDGSFNLSGIALASFVGSDPLELLLRTQYVVSGLCDDDDRGDTCTASNSFFWAGSVSALYDYTPLRPTDPTDPTDPNNPPVAVSEPATLPLLGFGLLSLSAAMFARGRRLRKGLADSTFGSSWKRVGEKRSIFSQIAGKVQVSTLSLRYSSSCSP